MCFGNKLNQNRPEHCITPFPTPNNFCGGFALNAVLVDLGSGTCPIEVYMRIQDYQNKEIIEKNPESAASKYLLGNKSSGTLMSLPSGICAAFKDYVTDRTVTVCYSSNFKSDFFKDLIPEEIKRILLMSGILSIKNIKKLQFIMRYNRCILYLIIFYRIL